MISRKAVLLIVKQNPGMNYNSLVNKIGSSYLNLNSARAAVSRIVKEASSFGLLERKNDELFLTREGEREIVSELKNKLLLNLNESIHSKQIAKDPSELVKLLAILIERSKSDPNLLIAAKNSSNFFVADVLELIRDLNKKIQQDLYLYKVLRQQVNELKKLNFNDLFFTRYSKQSLWIIKKLLSAEKEKEFSMEANNIDFIQKTSQLLNVKPKGLMVILKMGQFKRLIKLLHKQLISTEGFQAHLFFSDFSIEINEKMVSFTASYEKIKFIQEFFKNKD